MKKVKTRDEKLASKIMAYFLVSQLQLLIFGFEFKIFYNG